MLLHTILSRLAVQAEVMLAGCSNATLTAAPRSGARVQGKIHTLLGPASTSRPAAQGALISGMISCLVRRAITHSLTKRRLLPSPNLEDLSGVRSTRRSTALSPRAVGFTNLASVGVAEHELNRSCMDIGRQKLARCVCVVEGQNWCSGKEEAREASTRHPSTIVTSSLGASSCKPIHVQ